MKKKLFSILAIGAIAITSCNKDEEALVMGTAMINGTIRADIDQTNDINGAGLYESDYMPDAVEGMVVKVEVDTKLWDESPDASFDYAKKVYSTTTNSSGEFSLELPATTDGYSVTVTFEDLHGVTRMLYTTDGADLTEESYVSKGDESVFIYEGADLDFVYDADMNTTNNENYEYGMATVTGRFVLDWDQTSDAAVSPYWGTMEEAGTGSPMAGKTLYWGYNWAPYGNGSQNQFAFTLDSEGKFSFEVPTYVISEFSSVGIYFGFDDFVADQVIDNAAGTADSLVPSIYSIGGINSITTSLYDGDVYNNAFGISITNI